MRKTWTGLTIVLCLWLTARLPLASGPPTLTDYFLPVINLTATASGRGLVGAHGVTLPDSSVYLFGRETLANNFFSDIPFAGRFTFPVVYPSNISVTNETLPFDTGAWGGIPYTDQGFCGITRLGQVPNRFTLYGGTRGWADPGSQTALAAGVPYALRYATTSGTWTRLAGNMTGVGAHGYNGRWYPNAVSIPGANDPALVVGGAEVLDLSASYQAYLQNPNAQPPPPVPADYSPNLTVELHDTVAGFHAPVAMPADVYDEDYTKVNLLPDGRRVLMSGQSGSFWTYDLTTQAWTDSGLHRAGNVGEVPNYGASTVVLPNRVVNREFGYSNGSTLTCGGQPNTDSEHSCDLYDPDLNTLTRYDMGVRKSFPLVMNGFEGVSILGGFSSDGSNGGAAALMFSPRTKVIYQGTSHLAIGRAYHMVAPVMSSGAMLVAGGAPGGRALGGETPTAEPYFPFYMLLTRPTVTSSPATVHLGHSYQVVVTSATPVSEVTLFGLSSVTHNQDNGYGPVQLRVTAQQSSGTRRTLTVSVRAVGDGLLPGQYWLVALDGSLVPSAGVLVTVAP